MAEEAIEEYILELLRRRRRVTKKDILDWLMEVFWARPPTPSEIQTIMRIIRRLEITGAVVRREETVKGPVKRYIWYWTEPARRIILRRPGQRVTEQELSRIYGIPLEQVRELTELMLKRRWLLPTPIAGVYLVPAKLYRVQKFRAWRTDRKMEAYEVAFLKPESVPRQLVLDGYASSETTSSLETGVHGAFRIVIYTANPEAWPEDRLERIMRGLFAQENITLEIFSNRPYIHKIQAYEVKEIDIEEKPVEVDIDEPDIWLWIAKEEGYTYVYHYRRRPWGWTYERYIAK